MKFLGVVLMMASGAIVGLVLGFLMGVPVIGLLSGGLLAAGCGMFVVGAWMVNSK